MALTHDQMHHLAHDLMDALEGGGAIEPLTEQAPGITEHDAREIAFDILGHRMGHGHRIVGKKVGLTSQATQRSLGIDAPQFGVILDDMTVRDGGRVKASSLIAPRVEPEIAFRLKSALIGPGITAADVLAATDYVFPALEIADSRIKDWRIKLEDLVADNVAAALVVLGSARMDPAALGPRAGDGRVRGGRQRGRGVPPARRCSAIPPTLSLGALTRLRNTGWASRPASSSFPGR